MNLGNEIWVARKPSYDQLKLAMNGDDSERAAFGYHPWAISFGNYERFWRYHVAPASRRPFGIELRPEADEVICDLAQRSFSTFRNIFEAAEQCKILKVDGLGERERNATIALHFAGDALGVFCGLDNAAVEIGKRLSVNIQSARELLPNWKLRYDRLKIYRDYLSHQGTLMTLVAPNALPLVLRPEYIVGNGNINWVSILREHLSKDSHWQELPAACYGVADEVLKMINEGYGVLTDVMEELLIRPEYQRLWGWTCEMDTASPHVDCYSGGSGTGTGIGTGDYGSFPAPPVTSSTSTPVPRRE